MVLLFIYSDDARDDEALKAAAYAALDEIKAPSVATGTDKPFNISRTPASFKTRWAAMGNPILPRLLRSQRTSPDPLPQNDNLCT
ncbi:unnamed protein product [Diplocarpon coronariae]